MPVGKVFCDQKITDTKAIIRSARESGADQVAKVTLGKKLLDALAAHRGAGAGMKHRYRLTV
jgi:hypothetical protein